MNSVITISCALIRMPEQHQASNPKTNNRNNKTWYLLKLERIEDARLKNSEAITAKFAKYAKKIEDLLFTLTPTEAASVPGVNPWSAAYA
jgi:hypothetical protein